MTRKVGLLGILALASLAAACGEDGGAKCVATLCDAGAVCVGHAVQTCAADGKRFVYTACSAQERCEAGAEGSPSGLRSAACIPRACTTLGASSCATPIAVRRCRADGSGFEEEACSAGQECKDGSCVKTECAGEPDRCTNSGFVHCVEGAWVQENCPVNQLCALSGSGDARCQERACQPEARRCDGDSARVCDERGAVEAIEACDKAEVCVDGVCQAEVCGATPPADVAEVSDVDVVDGADTAEPESEVVFTLAGATNRFDISAYAEFDAGDRELAVRASKGQKAILLRFTPANATVSGAFSSEVFNPVKVFVCYDSGGTVATFEDCPGDFTHHSVAYEVTITRNDGPGGRFEATFSATLEDVNTDPIAISAGQINVKYR